MVVVLGVSTVLLAGLKAATAAIRKSRHQKSECHHPFAVALRSYNFKLVS